MKDSQIDHAVGLCKKLVAYFSHSWKWRRELAVAQEELNLPEQQTVTGRVLTFDQKASHLTPTWQGIEVLEVINMMFTPLTDFADALSGEQYITISSVKPVLHLFETMMAVQEDDTDHT